MEKIFFTVLNMSITASYVVLFVLLARFILKKHPKYISYALWSIVLFRLICPISFSSDFSFFNYVDNNSYVSSNTFTQSQNNIETALSEQNNINIVEPVFENTTAQISESTVSPFTLVWIVGFAVMTLYSLFYYISLKRKVSTSILMYDNIFESENISYPFVFGVIKPKIYLPVGISETEKTYVLKHEQFHIKRFDHIIKLVSFFVLSVHWFNPLVWLSFILMSKDMEMSCDEKVVSEIGMNIKKDYSTSLLSMATNSQIISGSPLAFGENSVKSRIKNILNYKKPAFWISFIAIIFVVVFGVLFVSNGKNKDIKEELSNLDLIVTLPASWENKYKLTNYDENNDSSIWFTQVLEDGTEAGVIFGIIREIGEDMSDRFIQTYPGAKKIVTFNNGYSYLCMTPTDVQAPIEHGEAAVEEYGKLFKDTDEIFNNLKPITGEGPVAKNSDFKLVGTDEFIVEIPKNYKFEKEASKSRLAYNLMDNSNSVGVIEFLPYKSSSAEYYSSKNVEILNFDEYFRTVTIVLNDELDSEILNKISESFVLRGGSFTGIDLLTDVERYKQLGAQEVFGQIESVEIDENNAPIGVYVNTTVFKIDETEPNGFKLIDQNETKYYSFEYADSPSVLPLAAPDFIDYDIYFMPRFSELLENGKLKEGYNTQFFKFIIGNEGIKIIIGQYIP